MVPEQDFRNTRFEKQNFSKFAIFSDGRCEKIKKISLSDFHKWSKKFQSIEKLRFWKICLKMQKKI
mgnify:CR=1 FL=1